MDGISPNRGESFANLETNGADFRTMSENIIKTCAPEATQDDRLYGQTRIFMSQKFNNELDNKLEVAQKFKKDAIEV